MDAAASPRPSRSTLLSTYWRDPEYLAHVPLTSSTALDYFSRSNFFDPESTNEVLRMQNIGNPQALVPGMGKTAKQQEDELKRFKGIEFVVVHAKESRPGQVPAAAGSPGADDSLFVIQKRRRESPSRTQVLETYYILNGNVHMAPDLESVLSNRIITALHLLRESLALARSAQARPVVIPTHASQTSKSKAKTLGAGVAEESAQTTTSRDGDREEDGGTTSVREEEERPRKVPSVSQAHPISSILEPSKPESESPLSTMGSFLISLQHFAFEKPLGTAATSAVATVGSLLVYWRYFRRIRSAEYMTPRDLRWRRSLMGKVTHVGDADGFRLYHQPGPPLLRNLFYPIPKTVKARKEQTLSIRLAGADAPELGHFGKPSQPFAAEAKDELTRLLGNRTVRCEAAQIDQYKRLVATPYVWLPPYVFGSTNVSLALVKKGLATVYRQGGADYGSATFLSRVFFKAQTGLGRLERAEASAKRRKLGIWSLGHKLETPADYKRRFNSNE